MENRVDLDRKIRSFITILACIIIGATGYWLIVGPIFELGDAQKSAMMLAIPVVAAFVISTIAIKTTAMSLKSGLRLFLAILAYLGLGTLIHVLLIGTSFNPDAMQSWMTVLGWPVVIAFGACVVALIAGGATMIAIGFYTRHAPLIISGPIFGIVGIFLARLI